MIAKSLTPGLRGWGNYFRIAEGKSFFREIDQWVRLRAIRLHQCKRMYARASFLMGLGVPPVASWTLAKSSKGMWRLSSSPPAHQGMNKRWFDHIGLFSLEPLG